MTDDVRREKFNQRILAMLTRHQFYNPDYKPMVDFAMKNNLDKTRSTRIYKLYTIHLVDEQMKVFYSEKHKEEQKEKELELEKEVLQNSYYCNIQ